MDGYDLYLFDFDGLLVNTERLHHEAYLRLLESYGYNLGWTFVDFCKICHPDSKGSFKAVKTQFPDLVERVGWDTLYRQKGEHYLDLLKGGKVSLMPGAGGLLEKLATKGVKRAVVTHSPFDQIALIRKQVPLLDTIPHWVTREQYAHAKPHPEAYLKALELKKAGEQAIGFEDSLRGVRALKGSGACAVIVCSSDYPFLKDALELGAIHMEQLHLVSS